MDICPNALQGTSAHLFMTLINALLAAQCDLAPDGRYPPNYGPNLKDGDEFDFIVVGAGTAGSVVASRLSEMPEWRVLLIEAGGYPSATSEIPAFALALQDSGEDWQYTMEPSKTCCISPRNNKCRCPKGKGLGGTSLLNGMNYQRSIKHDHDIWEAAGNIGWDHESIVKHYKTFENVHDDASGVYGTTGNLHITKQTSNQTLQSVLKNAYQELGCTKYTEEKTVGYVDVLFSIYQGTRQSTAKAFLAPIKNRKNVYLVVNATVERLLFNDINAVQGVELTLNGASYKIRAHKEVILSAGSIKSPQILIKSGIGPKEHLTELGINIVKDLKVGENYHVHLGLPVLGVALDRTAVPSEPPDNAIDSFYQIFMHRKVDVGLASIASFINTHNLTSHFPDIQYLHILIPERDKHALQEVSRVFGIHETAANSFQNTNTALLLFIPLLMAPKSRGFVRLQSVDPQSKPLILPNCLNDDKNEDIERMLKSVKFIQKLISTPSFSQYKPQMVDIDIPNCESLEPQSDEFWRCAIKNTAFPAFHHVGTCKMGPVADSKAVVDPRLKVHGVENLRVIDASIIPILRSNPFGAVVMVGEKGAKMIKEDWLR